MQEAGTETTEIPCGGRLSYERKEKSLYNKVIEHMERVGIVAVGLGEVLFDHDLERDDYRFGGAPANFADHFLKCSRLIAGDGAAEVHVVSAVGALPGGAADPWGREVERQLARRGLAGELERVPGRRTGMVDKRRDAAGVNAYDILPAAWDRIGWSDRLRELAQRTDAVCFGSLAQREGRSRRTIVRFLREMIRTGRRTLRVFDANIRGDFYSEKVLRESIRLCNVLKISDEELPAVARSLGMSWAEGAAEPFCMGLLAAWRNLDLVILTEGAKGSRIFLRDRISVCVIPARERRRPVDTVGAGDSFTAAFCAMLVAGKDIWEAQRFASRVAAFVCSKASATPAYPPRAAAWLRP